MAYVVRKLVEQYFYLNDDCSGLYPSPDQESLVNPPQLTPVLCLCRSSCRNMADDAESVASPPLAHRLLIPGAEMGTKVHGEAEGV